MQKVGSEQIVGGRGKVGKVMGTGWTGKERERLIVSRQTIEKSQHKIEMQSIRLWLEHKGNCTCTQFNIQTQK